MIRAFLALAMFAGVVGLASMNIEAQTKKDAPPAKKVEAAKLGAVEIYKGKAGMRYRIVDAEGKTIAMPPPAKHWETKDDVIKAIDEVKDTLNKVKPTEVKE